MRRYNSNNNSNSNNNNNNNYKYRENNNFIYVPNAGVNKNGEKTKKTANIKSELKQNSQHSYNLFVKMIENLYEDMNSNKVRNNAKTINKEYIDLQARKRTAYNRKVGKTTKPPKTMRKTFSLYPLSAILLYNMYGNPGNIIVLPSLFLGKINTIITKKIKIEWKAAKNKKEIEYKEFKLLLNDNIIEKYFKNSHLFEPKRVSSYFNKINQDYLNISDTIWKKAEDTAIEFEKSNDNDFVIAESIVFASILYENKKFNSDKFNLSDMRPIKSILKKIEIMKKNKMTASGYKKK